MRIGAMELLLVLLIVVVVFGPTQIPKLARMLGKGLRSFREGLNGDEGDEGEAGGHEEGQRAKGI